MKTVLLTSNNLRHKYLVSQLSVHTDLQLVITEKKSPTITDTSGLRAADANFIQQHFEKRRLSEEEYFEAYQDFPLNTELLEVAHGTINSNEVFLKLENINPDFIILFGTSIIKKDILNQFINQVINFHLGLSPYYRGSATNLFPYYYREPECVGGTIHLATSEVDRGGILHQFRPDISKNDDLHAIGNKTIVKGGKLLPRVLKMFKQKKINPKTQQGKGCLCKTKDLSPAKLRRIYQNFEEGMIGSYLRNKENRDRVFPIIQPEFISNQ